MSHVCPHFLKHLLFLLQYKLCKVKKILIGTKGIPHLVTHDARTIRYPDPLIKVNDTVRIDLESSKITDFIKFDTGTFSSLHNLQACFPVNEEHLWPLIFTLLFFQVTCAWWPVVLTWGVSVWSPTGSVTPAPSTWCTSRTAQATALLPGSPTSLSLARWEIRHCCLQHTASRPGGCKILGPVRRNVLKVLLLCRVFWSILTVYQSVS